MPRVYPEGRVLDNKRYDIGAAIAELLDDDTPITPDGLHPDRIETDAAEAVALAIVVQGWEFIRARGWDEVATGDFGDSLLQMERSVVMLDPLAELLECHPQGGDRAPILKALASSARHLRQSVREGRRLAAEEPAAHGQDLPDQPLDVAPSFDSLDAISDETLTATRKEHKTPFERWRDAFARTRKRWRRKKGRQSARTRGAGPRRRADRCRGHGRADLLPGQAAPAETGRGRHDHAAAGAGRRVAVAAALSVHRAHGRRLPQRARHPGIMRYAGDDPVIVFLVGPAWYDLDDAARVDQAAALAEQAERLESLDSVVIRDAGGRDVAQVFGTHVVLVH